MARSRNIKPGFFKNEHLAELPPLTRLLFEALWCEADRTGRLEDRPLRIKAEYFAYDNYDVSTGLAQLQHSAGMFITRYEVDGKRYIQVNNFLKHQNPHKDEKARNIPPPPKATDNILNNQQNSASTIPAQCKHRTCLVLAGLIPDSLNLIPDSSSSSLSPVKVIEKEGKGVVEEKPKDEKPEPMRVSEAQELYVRYFGRINTGQGIGSVLQDICREYPPEHIREAFQAAGAANAKALLWVINRLKGLEGGEARASPRFRTFSQMRTDNSRQACRDFAEGDDG